MIHDVTLKANPLQLGKRQTHSVWWEGKLLLAASRDPEFDACRALQALGLAGKLRVRWDGETAHSMLISIEWGAAKRTAEGSAYGPAVSKWEPFKGFPALEAA
jgi:hypothetical protein